VTTFEALNLGFVVGVFWCLAVKLALDYWLGPMVDSEVRKAVARAFERWSEPLRAESGFRSGLL